MLRDHRRVSTGARWLRHREACAPVVGRAGARGVDQAAAPIGLRGVVGRAYASLCLVESSADKASLWLICFRDEFGREPSEDEKMAD